MAFPLVLKCFFSISFRAEMWDPVYAHPGTVTARVVTCFFLIKRIPTNLHLLGGERKFNAKIHIKGHSSTITNDKTWNLPSFSLFTSNVFWPITKCGHFSCRTAFTVQGCRLCSKQLGISTHGGRFQVEKRTKYILYSYVCPYPIESMV